MEVDEVCITGVSGRFPECENVEQFIEALFKGADLLTEDDRRFKAGLWDTPKLSGKLLTIDKFDASFFGIAPKAANFMDPRQRILNEVAYEAIIDSGYNPEELKGSKTGVYVGISSFSNSEELRKHKTDGYANLGLPLSLASNRISYAFDLKGPSCSIDTACASSSMALVSAVNDMKAGITEAALVCGAHLIFHPHETLEFKNLNMLAPDGRCRVFSTKRSGYARSETVGCLFLQRRSKSRRIYGTVIGAKTNTDGYKKEGLTCPSAEVQLQLMQSVFEENKINPNEVTYVEAHGTGTPLGDVAECTALASMFCENRREPLPIGAVKSNMGHSEIASGINSLVKIIATMESGIIPANLHVQPLDTSIPGICDGKLQVVTTNTPFRNGLISSNCFGFGGCNVHCVIKPHNKIKSLYNKLRHRLVCVSGRTEEAVNYFLDEIIANQNDNEFLALVDEIHKKNINGHNYRGYVVLGESCKKEIQRSSWDRPVWFIYTGMGPQFITMGKDMLKIDVFRRTFERCAAAVKPYNINLVDIVTNSDPAIFNDITNCFVAITAIQIALTELLFSFGIRPDGLAGHSLGEVGCSYADGHLTPEQAILLSFARGYACRNSNIPPGLMAAIGMSKEEVKKILPPDVIIACQNGKTSVTISGLEKPTKDFVAKLSSQGVFAKTVQSTGIAFHSPYIAEAKEIHYNFIKPIIKDPKPRSSRWVSSSVPPCKAHEDWARLNCAEYHVNNFNNTVLFDQIYEYIPENAIVVEVAPHGLMQAILKKELASSTTNISLMNRSTQNNEEFFLSAIGKIFLAGGQPQLRSFYPDVSFPVSRGTKMISPMVKWDHSVSWLPLTWINKDFCGEHVTVDLSDPEYSHLIGHEIDGRVLMPATGYLVLVWKVFAELQEKTMEEVPIIAENILFKRATVLPQTGEIKFVINIAKQSGNFEIFEGGSVVANGRIRTTKYISKEFVNPEEPQLPQNNYLPMSREDVYKECSLRRYMYAGDFQGIIETDVNGLRGLLEWKGKFDSFLDSIFHLSIVTEQSRDLSLPTYIQRVVIDPHLHLELVNKSTEVKVTYNQDLNIFNSGGVEIVGVEFSRAPKRQQTHAEPVIEKQEFVYFENNFTNSYDLVTSLTIAMQIVLQNIAGLVKKIKICEILSTSEKKLSENVEEILSKEAIVEPEFHKMQPDTLQDMFDVLLITESVMNEFNSSFLSHLVSDGFILYSGNYQQIERYNLEIIFQSFSNHDSVFLLRKPQNILSSKCAFINVSNYGFNWLDKLKFQSQSRDHKVVYLVSQGEETTGLFGLMKCLLTEPSNASFRAIITDNGTEQFSPEAHKDHLRKNLIFNVLRGNKWGTFVHVPIGEIEKVAVEDASITLTTIGDLSSVKWIERPSYHFKPAEQSESVHVFYSALNFKDVMVSSGQLLQPSIPFPTAPDINIGIEYSGMTNSGKRVMGIVCCEGLSLQLNTDPHFTWLVPDHWTLEDAATVPCVYSTCYYALIMRGNMRQGESILIHAGSGGIGMAAISIALRMKCDVFTTVSSSEKKSFLKQIFPELKDENIGNSRNKSFEDMIMKNTKRRGVDLVLNSLAGELFQASIRCLARRGRFLEIGKVDFLNRSQIDSNIFLKNASFHGIFLDDLLETQSELKETIQELLTKGIETGVVNPLPRTVFLEEEVEEAFRYLSTGKHKGKVLVQIRKEVFPQISPKSLPRTIMATPKVYFNSKKSHIIIGGLGGIGLEVCDWIIRKGATKIILNSRRAAWNGYQSYCLRKWSQLKDVQIQINTDDTVDLRGAEKLIAEAKKLGPVGSIFNMSVVLRDNLITKQTCQDFEDVFKPKLISGLNMDTLSRKFCPELDHFVVFSSVASGRGNIGQSNYGMANSALERLCEKRKRENLPGLAIQFGPVKEVGVSLTINQEEKILKYMVPQTISSCLKTLETVMLQSSPVTSSIVLADRSSSAQSKYTKSVVEAIAHILGINNLDHVDKMLTLTQLGLDSLMLAEIKQTLYRNYQMDLSADEIRELKINDLIQIGGSRTKTDEISSNSDCSQISSPFLMRQETFVTLNSNTLDKNVFFLHPIEGHIDGMRNLAKELKANVYGLQFTKECKFDEIETIGTFYLQGIKNIQARGPYYLCGYSFGAVLAFEIGLQLEKIGEEVELFLVDGSPLYVKNFLVDQFIKNESSMDKSQLAILTFFAASFPNIDLLKLPMLLQTSLNSNERNHEMAKYISSELGLQYEDILSSIESLCTRVTAGYTYEPKQVCLGGKLMLIRAEENIYEISESYGLDLICKQLKIEKLQGDHRTILKDKNVHVVAKLINERLGNFK